MLHEVRWELISVGPQTSSRHPSSFKKLKKKNLYSFGCVGSFLTGRIFDLHCSMLGLLVAACGIQFSDQKLNLGSLHWEHGVLDTGQPGKWWSTRHPLLFTWRRSWELSEEPGPFPWQTGKGSFVQLWNISVGELQWSGLQACKQERERGSQIILSLHFFFPNSIFTHDIIQLSLWSSEKEDRNICLQWTLGEEETQQIKYLVKVGG